MTVADPAVVAEEQVEAQRRATEQLADRAARRTTLIDRSGIVLPFLLVFGLGVALAPNFLTGANLRSVLVNTAILAIVGYGMTLAITLRGLDLSVGSVAALATVVSASMINSAGILGGVLAALLVGMAAGLINGALIAFVRIPPFVTTLAMMTTAQGVALLIADGQRVQLEDGAFRSVATTQLLGVPLPFWIAVAIGVLAHLGLQRTAMGRHVCAVGGNPDAALEAGLRHRRITVGVYVVCAVAAAVSGVLVVAQLGTVDATPIIGLELQAIAIAVLGGTSLRGGTGNMLGTLTGALVLGMISAGLNLRNIPGYYQYLALGLVLLLALALDQVRVRARRSARSGTS